MNQIGHRRPLARQRELITKEIDSEMLVYELDTNQMLCLNSTAARVWANCDGRTTVSEMAKLLEDEMKTPIAEEVVWLALEQLSASRLLEETWTVPAPAAQLSRRSLVMRLGVAA